MTYPKFGTRIRAARLGYGWSSRHGAFIRMSTSGSRNFVELCPGDRLPTKGATKEYRCWWDTPEILDYLPWLRSVRRVKVPIRVEVDDAGRIVKERAKI